MGWAVMAPQRGIATLLCRAVQGSGKTTLINHILTGERDKVTGNLSLPPRRRHCVCHLALPAAPPPTPPVLFCAQASTARRLRSSRWIPALHLPSPRSLLECHFPLPLADSAVAAALLPPPSLVNEQSQNEFGEVKIKYTMYA